MEVPISLRAVRIARRQHSTAVMRQAIAGNRDLLASARRVLEHSRAIASLTAWALQNSTRHAASFADSRPASKVVPLRKAPAGLVPIKDAPDGQGQPESMTIAFPPDTELVSIEAHLQILGADSWRVVRTQLKDDGVSYAMSRDPVPEPASTQHA